MDDLAGNTLLEVIRTDLFFIPATIMLVVFGVIAMIAISNTTLVSVVGQSRILFGMAAPNPAKPSHPRLTRRPRDERSPVVDSLSGVSY